MARCPNAPAEAPGPRLKADYAACLSKELLDQFIEAAVDKGHRGGNYLLAYGCILTRAGVPVSILDRGAGWREVRAYLDASDESVVVWTTSEAIDEQDSPLVILEASGMNLPKNPGGAAHRFAQILRSSFRSLRMTSPATPTLSV